MAPRTIMVFIDGFGIGSADPAVNPFYGGTAPVLTGWLARHAVSLDATLGVAGLPQSATGQTALFTGINAAAEIGHHVQGFPCSRLRAIIEEHNIYDRLAARGYRSAYANAYYLESMPERLARRMPSVTTVAAMKAFGKGRDGVDMRAGKAVYHDLTRDGLRERGFEGPFLTPEESARDLLALAGEQDFTLFEFFQSDQAGHRGTMDEARAVARKLERLAAALERSMDPERDLLVITSDHGNMEEMSTRQHTYNPVPLIALGAGSDRLLRSARSIMDVTPALMALYPAKNP